MGAPSGGRQRPIGPNGETLSPPRNCTRQETRQKYRKAQEIAERDEPERASTAPTHATDLYRSQGTTDKSQRDYPQADGTKSIEPDSGERKRKRVRDDRPGVACWVNQANGACPAQLVADKAAPALF